jgi:hypothetical protein
MKINAKKLDFENFSPFRGKLWFPGQNRGLVITQSTLGWGQIKKPIF